MHFITGGSFNGKSKWVKEYYQLEEASYRWISCYENSFPSDVAATIEGEDLFVIEGVEMLLKEWALMFDRTQSRKKWQLLLNQLAAWENQESRRRVILIGTDITKGIVPVSAKERKWRDLTGWAYQDAVKAAKRADLIWYGVSQKIK
jgi:adenosylcobinamide kinase / adenosylcobinamide-phosphate guanylyltransferase